MREYARTCATFWTRGSGKRLKPLPDDPADVRRRKRDAQALAQYLLSGPYSNLIGLYYLPLPMLCSDVGLTEDEARAALAEIAKAKFALYDEDASLTWVMNAAEIELGAELSEFDKRRGPVMRELEMVGSHPFADLFVERYGEAFRLRPRKTSPGTRKAPSAPPSAPSDAPTETLGASETVPEGASAIPSEPSKGHPRSSTQDQGQKQAQGQKQEQAQGQGVQGEPSQAPPPATPLVLSAPEEPTKSKTKRGKRERIVATRIPADWQPTEKTAAWCREIGVDPVRARDAFVDYWRGERVEDFERADWEAVFRNRVRRLVEDGRAPTYEPPEPLREAVPADPPRVLASPERYAELGAALDRMEPPKLPTTPRRASAEPFRMPPPDPDRPLSDGEIHVRATLPHIPPELQEQERARLVAEREELRTRLAAREASTQSPSAP